MRRDLILLMAIAAAAMAVRVVPPWGKVFGPGHVTFLETDAWYHVRLVENQVRNFPWRVTLDPYAAPGGQFVPIAPLYDTITSTVVVLLHGRQADVRSVERVASFVPPVMGTLAVVIAWALGRRLFDRRAGLLAAALLAVLPGHFLDRTMLAFVDHHALEALLALITLLAIVRGLQPPSPAVTSVPTGVRGRRLLVGTEVGVALGLYLLAWGSGAFLVAILGAWLLMVVPLARTADSLRHAARMMGTAALVALALVAVFQDSRMHRYGSQIIGLVGLTAIALAAWTMAGRELTRRRTVTAIGGVVVTVVVGAITARVVNPDVFAQIVTDLGRLAPDPFRMAVLEARPLFRYAGDGRWTWRQPWEFFGAGFYIGLIALVPFARRIWRDRQPADLLLGVFAVTTFAATIGQNRFGYYLVPACALVGGWLATRILDWGVGPSSRDSTPTWSARIPLRRELAMVVVAGAMFGLNLSPTLLLRPQATFPDYWQDALLWLRRETPPPFLQAAGADDEYYLARYPFNAVPLPDYSVMNWWDQGYRLLQLARRVPVSNPTQARAGNAARFYVETDEGRARARLIEERARFVLSDWELPFRLTADGEIMGRFQSLLEWARAKHSEYYEIYYRRENDAWKLMWVFHEPYYQSMAYRLMVLGGTPMTPRSATTVLSVANRTDARGFRFREVLTLQTYGTYDAALQATASTQLAHTVIVGLDPWRSAFPLEGLTSFVQRRAVRTREQKPSEGPWVRIFEVKEVSPAR